MFLKELESSNVWNTFFLIKLLLCYQMLLSSLTLIMVELCGPIFLLNSQNKVQVLHNNLDRIILSADIRTPFYFIVSNINKNETFIVYYPSTFYKTKKLVLVLF